MCFRSGDGEGHGRFGDDPVEIGKLGLAPGLEARGEALNARHDPSPDWNDPGGPSRWTDDDGTAFTVEARAFLADVRCVLPSTRFDQDRRRSRGGLTAALHPPAGVAASYGCWARRGV